ncbi:MAG: nucleotidyltransferase domain-containing protein [Candidatus Cloacimonetes bacterium]|nr:nucleotidyltransferase domain-containing protein [Candidatus Cloacimonadota bacterium]
MSPFDISSAREFQKAKRLKREQLLQNRFDAAKRDFELITQMLIAKYNPQKIYQWGSLIAREHFSEVSDIDIALEGITNPETYFKLLSEAQSMSDFSLDIVEMEKIHPLHREMIIRKGKLIYERS